MKMNGTHSWKAGRRNNFRHLLQSCLPVHRFLMTDSLSPVEKDQRQNVTGSPDEAQVQPQTPKQAIDGDNNNPLVQSPRHLEEADDARQRFGSSWAYLMTAVGYAVGLGNIWRFPAIAYNNGGGAFLIPYFTCTSLFGMPVFFLESFLGQYTQTGPGLVFYKFMPALQGVGWGMTFLSQQVNIYYLVIVGWAVVYLFQVVWGENQRWARCDNYWNKYGCQSPFEPIPSHCNTNDTTLVHYNGSCYYGLAAVEMAEKIQVPTEQFFHNFVLNMTEGIHDLGGMNWKLLFAMGILWTICGLIIWKGVAVMGKITYVTTLVPYAIVVIFFFHGFTLDGHQEGLRYYFRPNMTKLIELKTWKAALHQTCMSLTVGYGGIHAMASYNPPDHNSFRDAWIVVLADAVMSIVGGSAVFSTLGYLSKKTGKPIDQVVKDGFALTFVTYPEAMSTMWAPGLWAFLFFLMLCFLGISTAIVDTSTVIGCLTDCSPYLKSHEATVRVVVLLCLFAGSSLSCTNAGVYFITLMDECTGGIALALGLIMEFILIAHIYDRWGRLRQDLRSVFGKPRWGYFGKIFGKSGIFYWLLWKFFTPTLCIVILVISGLPPQLSYAKKDFPQAANIIGYLYGNSVLLFTIVFFIGNVLYFRKREKSWTAAFKLHESHPSYKRIYGSPSPLVVSPAEQEENKESFWKRLLKRH